MGVVPLAHPDFPISEPGRKVLLNEGWIQLKRGQESRFWPGKLADKAGKSGRVR